MKHGKKYNESVNLIEKGKFYDVEEAVAVAVKTGTAKFDETVEIHVRLGVDSRHADQQVRGAVVLPNGTGKTVRTSFLQRVTRLKTLRLQVQILLAVTNLLLKSRMKAGSISMLLLQHRI